MNPNNKQINKIKQNKQTTTKKTAAVAVKQYQNDVWNKNQKSTGDAATVSSQRSAVSNRRRQNYLVSPVWEFTQFWPLHDFLRVPAPGAAGGLEPFHSSSFKTRQWTAVIHMRNLYSSSVFTLCFVIAVFISRFLMRGNYRPCVCMCVYVCGGRSRWCMVM